MSWRDHAVTAQNTDCILAIDDRVALFLAAYKRAGFSCDAGAESLDSAWNSCTFKAGDVSRATGIPERLVTRSFGIAKSMGMIYPDGTINETADRYVKTLIARKLKSGR